MVRMASRSFHKRIHYYCACSACGCAYHSTYVEVQENFVGVGSLPPPLCWSQDSNSGCLVCAASPFYLLDHLAGPSTVLMTLLTYATFYSYAAFVTRNQKEVTLSNFTKTCEFLGLHQAAVS